LSEKPVFFDAKGTRSRRAVRLSATLGLIAAATITCVLISVFLLLPFIPGLPGSNVPVFLRSSHPPLLGAQADELRQSGFLLSKSRKELKDQIRASQARRKRLPKVALSGPVVAAFYAPWQETGLPSLRTNARKFTHLMPEWLHLTPNGQGLDLKDFDPQLMPHTQDVVRIADQNGLRVYPILNNGTEGVFDPKRVALLLNSPDAQQVLIARVVQWLKSNEFEGLNLDFENLDSSDYDRLPEFCSKLAASLNASGLGFSADVEASHLEYARKLVPFSDFLILMDYDEHYESGAPGPIASLGWFTENVATALKFIPADKLVVGLGNYGYDWSANNKSAETLSYQEAVVLAKEARDDLSPDQRISFDPGSANSHFSYEDDEGHHEVWMLDGPSAYNEWKVAGDAGVRGAAVWSLGTEDPTIWNFIDAKLPTTPPASQALSKVSFPYEITPMGDGEILYVPQGFAVPEPGLRKVSVDSNGYVEGAKYTTYPTSIVVKREGKSNDKVALTFDDGPSSDWTPQILDTLKELNVPGTFFVIGENAVGHPGLLRRMYNEGHEIGSHSYTHPNLGAVSDFRVRLELESTQRAIQSIIGRSTILFRPPYNADSEPTTGEEVKPVAIASQMGYYTIGESVDPQDWSLVNPTRTGGVRERTSQEIADMIISDVKEHKGNVVLLHDAGGDRHMTVEALRIAVPKLQKAGFKFVAVSQLFGKPKTRDEVMPALTAKDLLILPFDKVFFYSWFGLSEFLTLSFLAAIGLGIARILLVTPLALVAAKNTRVPAFAEGEEPPVSVIIAAFNEENVIVRTVQSVLGSLYHKVEVVVVDDGSKDRTYEVVSKFFERNPRVKVLRQENGGKAAALNTGIVEATGDIHVYLDADTLLASDAILKLVRHFADPKVGAVAGNVKVGNRINLLTRLQAVEYIASQNLDRRAFAYVNAVTVVPGAIGAWRKTAVDSAGGYTSDTLAEDMDLTWRVRLAGWKIDNESEATAYTEAPASVRTFFKQRFRWAFGTLQCLFKHRKALGRHGWFGRVVLPALWVFQILMQVLGPFVDLNLIVSVGMFAVAWLSHSVQSKDWQPLPDAAQTMTYIGFMYAVFFLVELLGAAVAFKLDKEKKSLLWWLFLQRFFYRQIMYAVVWKALWAAIRGRRTGWGKLERKGTVHGEAVFLPPAKGEGKADELLPSTRN
jgi:poly-beta-1,6 N-acetyl-D-glucosamine synthase